MFPKNTLQTVKSRPTQIMQVLVPQFEKARAENEQTECKEIPLIWMLTNMQTHWMCWQNLDSVMKEFSSWVQSLGKANGHAPEHD